MDAQSSLKSLQVQNLLSFGESCPPLELGPLNVLIGPNASGKSNLIELVGLLQSAPKDLAESIREGGGIVEWLWKGNIKSAIGSLEALVNLPHQSTTIRYKLSLRRAGGFQFEIADERIENESPSEGHDRAYMYFGYANGRPML